MRKRVLLSSLAVMVMSGSVAEAGPHAVATADVDGEVVEQVFDAGDIVEVPLCVTSAGGAAVFGVDLGLAVTTSDVRIHSVTFHPAFAQALRRVEADLPANRYHTVRTQRLRKLDRRLGAAGAPVEFATVELEVLNETSFESALEVNARCALVGVVPDRAAAMAGEPGGRNPEAIRIIIANTRPEPDAAVTPEPEPWTEEEASLTFEVRPLGGGSAVEVLAPDTTYELHYHAGYDRVNDFTLFAVSRSPGPGFVAATAPASGPWSSPTYFEVEHINARSEYALDWDGEGNVLRDFVMGGWYDSDEYAGPQGHVCDFTTRGSGELTLDLMVFWFDREEQHCAWMRTAADYTVQESADDDAGSSDDADTDDDGTIAEDMDE